MNCFCKTRVRFGSLNCALLAKQYDMLFSKQDVFI